ncbi:hypothetical protein BC777_0938 [Yoonia maricola]|uniref:Uncharacterized protein n=1 Tax=Yoonia maricola TaxID=420999 RepID=A0A2M8WMD8_9RHOB|nr:hypothetical protein [Yoonia maricola]PJI92094.1 hypothetical protein BC777_0938 [Yoonia maricola]
MKRICPAAIVLFVGAASAVTAQPFSKSMAECAGLYAFGRDHVEREDAVHALEFGQAKWMNAAVVQAQEEGVPDPNTYVDAAMTAKYDEWSARGAMAVFAPDFGDWMDYCRAFGADQGIDLVPN